MESKFKIKVNCIFNPFDLKNIRKQSNLGRPDFFLIKKKCLKLLKFGEIY